MNSVIETLIDNYHPSNDFERIAAIKEIIQEIALAGLSHGGFWTQNHTG